MVWIRSEPHQTGPAYIQRACEVECIGPEAVRQRIRIEGKINVGRVDLEETVRRRGSAKHRVNQRWLRSASANVSGANTERPIVAG